MNSLNLDDVTFDGRYLVYKGMQLKVSPEFIQDAIHQSISADLIKSHILEEYNKNLAFQREQKLNQLGIW